MIILYNLSPTDSPCLNRLLTPSPNPSVVGYAVDARRFFSTSHCAGVYVFYTRVDDETSKRHEGRGTYLRECMQELDLHRQYVIYYSRKQSQSVLAGIWPFCRMTSSLAHSLSLCLAKVVFFSKSLETTTIENEFPQLAEMSVIFCNGGKLGGESLFSGGRP